MILSKEEKMLILAAGLGSVAFTLVLMLCKLCPWCPLHRSCPFRAKYDDEMEENGSWSAPKVESNYKRRKKKEPPREMVYYGPPEKVVVPSVTMSLLEGQQLVNGSMKHRKSLLYPTTPIMGGTNSADSTGSNNSPESGSPVTKSAPETLSLGRKSRSTESVQPPQLQFALHYNSEDEKLAIYVKSAKNLAATLFGTTSDCFLRILLVRDLKKGWGRRRSSLSFLELTSSGAGFDMAEFKTQIVRRSLNPNFNEYFSGDLKEKDKKFSVLKFAVCYVDKLGRHTLAYECHKSLGKVDLKDLKDFTENLKDFRPDLGELTLGLNYLPTAERLCVTAERATNLKIPGHLESPNPFLKAALVHRTKTLEKHRTGISWSTRTPEFQETLTFDLPVGELDKSSLVLVISHQESPVKQKQKEVNDSGVETGYCEESRGFRTRRRSAGNVLDVEKGVDGTGLYKSRSSGNVHAKTIVLGRLALGCHVTGEPCAHWLEMIRTPRTCVCRTHKLIP